MRFLAILTALFFGVTSLFAVIEKDAIGKTMKQKIDIVTAILQDKNIAKESLKSRIFELFDPVFDYALMAKLSLGPVEWKKLSEEQQQTFTMLFEHKLKSSYADKLDLYTDEVVAIKEVKPVKSHIFLFTELIGKETNYKIYDAKEKGWLIYDVDILGVSIIKTYRSQFSGILQKQPFDALIELLKQPETVSQ
mgnify:CR=1 FL=1